MSEPTEMQEGNVARESDQIRKKLLSGETRRTSAASSSSSIASFYNAFDEPYDGLSYLETTENDADVNATFLRLFDCQSRRRQRISEGNFGLLNALLEQEANINCADEYGQSPLHKVARRQQLDVAKFLIEKGADVNLGDNFGRTALHIAAIVDCPRLVELLIDSGVDTEVRTKGEQQTAVHYAARYGCTNTLATLQHRGADLAARDFKRRTPLFLAAAQARRDTARLLLQLGADTMAQDNTGQMCLSLLLEKLPSVALVALDQLHVVDHSIHKQYYYLKALESQTECNGNPGSLNSLLELIVIHKLFDVASHPAVRKLVDIKWKAYGLAGACVRLFLELFFIITWSILMMGVDWENRHVYTFPQSAWRAVLATVCVGQLAINVVAELGEFRSASRALRCWREWWRSELSQDLRFCHPCWPQENIYLEQELKKINKVKAKYFGGFWSFLHWLVLVLLLSLVGLHVALILKPSWNVAQRYDHLVAITIIPLWLHNMKHLRPFKIVGPLIIILGKMAVYILKAFFLFGQFFLAFFFSFWLIFGNKDVASFKTVPATLFTMFRISVVDMDEYEAMHKRDFTMLYILVASFLSITNIFVHNAILIAMLNQAYKRVSLNPVGNEYMQRVILLLSLEKNPLFRSRREGTRDYIQRCARFECSYGAGDEGPGSDGCGGGRDAAQLEYGRVSLKIEGAPRVAGRAAGNRVGAVDAVPPAGGGSGTVLGAACGGSGHPGGGAGAAGPPAGARGQEAEPRTAPSPAGKGNGSAIVNVT
ncbi:uncharacterized protein LOC116942515 isoform X2 [Petromyzon marinus]|uniref:uncharacterized protein LOC116942515 isoform X2 n=1 Tax=Petromyzon marinus TaxID=7757 RepID=UPI003F6E77EC